MDSIQIVTDAPADPAPAPPASTVVTSTGGVQITKPAEAITQPSTTERPAWLPEKFKSAEDMAKAYGELETKLGKPAAETPTAPAAPAPTAAQTAAKAALDMGALVTELATAGTLSADSKAKLAAAGITEADVSAHAAGQTAISERLTNEVAQIAGGTEQLKSVLEWARVNLPKEAAAAYNAAVDTGNVDLVKMAMAGVVAQYTAANGNPPVLVTGIAQPSTATEAFTSNRQIIDAMSDKRYATDEAYRNSVAQRLAVSKAFGR